MRLDGFEENAADFADVQKETVSLQAKGDTIAGYYCGARAVVVQGRPTKLHRFVLHDDREIDVWGSAILDARLTSVRPGTLARVQMIGTQPSKKGNPAKDYSVTSAPRFISADRLARARATMAERKPSVPNGASDIAPEDIPF